MKYLEGIAYNRVRGSGQYIEEFLKGNCTALILLFTHTAGDLLHGPVDVVPGLVSHTASDSLFGKLSIFHCIQDSAPFSIRFFYFFLPG